MQIIAIVSTLLLTTCLVQTSLLKSMTSERVIINRNSRFRPLATTLKTLQQHQSNQLIFASFPSYPQPRIKLEAEKLIDTSSSCEFDFPTMNEIERTLNFNSLANGKLVLSFLGAEDLFYNYVLSLVIDLAKCEFVAVTTPLNETVVGNAIVLVGEDVFDVFLERQRHCADGKACRLRYSDDGRLIGVTEFDIPDDADLWLITSVLESNFTDGYFYSVVLDNGTTVVQLMEQDLKVQREQTIDKPFLYSTSHGSVNSCRGVSPTSLQCELRNIDFRPRSSSSQVIIETRTFKNFMRAVRLFNLADGSAMIVYVLQLHDDRFSTYLQHVDLNGHVGNPFKFQEDVCKDFKDIGVHWMLDNFYCFDVYCPDAIFIKCAAVGEI